jgi:DNA-binding GntR family transcriptional regulator
VRRISKEKKPTASRAERVHADLLAAIQDGRYQPGDRLREEEIAAAFGVSRTPVREAISRLHSRGLLEMSNGGLAVTKLTRIRTLELYAVRQILEGSAARFAAQHASAGEIQALEHFITAFARSLAEPLVLAKINRDFHLAIREASHNTYLLRTLDEFDTTLALLPGTTFDAPGRGDQALAEHTQIVKAIKLRDPDAAEHAARNHIQQAQEARLSLLFAYN